MVILPSVEMILVALTVVALLWTKALDIQSTWKHLRERGESNPLANFFFSRFGIVGGLAVVAGLYLLILSGQVVLVIWKDDPWLTYGTVVLGLGISWIQWDVARVNTTGRHSRLTAFLLRCFRIFRR